MEVNPIAPSIRLNRARVPQGSALEITYTWALEPGAKELRHTVTLRPKAVKLPIARRAS